MLSRRERKERRSKGESVNERARHPATVTGIQKRNEWEMALSLWSDCDLTSYHQHSSLTWHKADRRRRKRCRQFVLADDESDILCEMLNDLELVTELDILRFKELAVHGDQLGRRRGGENSASDNVQGVRGEEERKRGGRRRDR